LETFDASLEAIVGNNLERGITIYNALILQNLNFENLKHANGTLDLGSLPVLTEFIIDSTTFWSWLEMIETGLQVLPDFQLIDSWVVIGTQSFGLAGGPVGNPCLSSVNVTTIASWFQISGNSGAVTVTFPNLLSAETFEVDGLKLLNIHSLVTVSGPNGTMSMTHSTLDYISAPDLVSLSNDLSIKNCTNLISVSFPKLETVNETVFIQGNSSLTSLVFPAAI
jgi:hypothetical protein